MSHTKNYLDQVIEIANNLDCVEIERMANILADVRNRGGRLFFLGVGGGAGHASHAVNDFRKLCNIDAYTPVDNVSEITAKTNDEGFNTIFDSYLILSKFSSKDLLMVFSVGGGNMRKNVSVNLIKAIKYAKIKNGKIICVVGKSDGYAYKNSNANILINVENKNLVTPVSETFQCLLWHLFVSHPELQVNKTKW